MANQADRIQQRLGTQTTALAEKPATFEQWMEQNGGVIQQALPDNITAARFSRMILTSYEANPELRLCTLPSVVGAALQAAQIGLMIGALDQAYLIPYTNSKIVGRDDKGKAVWEKVKEAQLQIGYKGYMELGYRTGRISKIRMEMVYASDEFSYSYGTDEYIKHVPKGLEAPTDRPTHYYVIVFLTNGDQQFLVRTYQQILEHAKKHTNLFNEDGSVNKKSTWFKNYNRMALKTVIRDLFAHGTIQLTTDVMLALSADETIKNVDAGNISSNMAEEIIDVTNWEVQEDPPTVKPEPAQEPVKQEQKQEQKQAAGGDPGPVDPSAGF